MTSPNPVKLTNQEAYSKYLTDYPPEYKIGDKVKTNLGIGYISGHVFNERLKTWKYTFTHYSLHKYMFDVEIVYGKV